MVRVWFALETDWLGSPIRTNAASAAKHVSGCVLGYAHL